MPAKLEDMKIPDWVLETGDECLEETLIEAYVARTKAQKRGVADQEDDCLRVFASGDQTIAQIRDGRVTGTQACKKAAVALRKFNTALECVAPSAKRTR